MAMKPISILLALVYTPVSLAFLGDTKYGIWAIILNIVSWINYFDIGIGNGLRNKLAEAIALDDQKAAKQYVSTAYVGTSLISLIFAAVISLTWCLFGLSDLFHIAVSDESTNAVVVLSVVFVCVNFVLSLSKTSAYAIQQPGVISVVSVIGQALQLGTVFLISHFFRQSLMAIALTYGLISLLENVILYLFIIRGRPFLRPSLREYDNDHLKPLVTLGIGFFVMQISSLVLNTTDNLLISYLYGSDMVTPYNIAYKAFYMLVQFHAIIILPMWSAYTEAAARNDLTWIRRTLKKVDLITMAFAGAAVIGIFAFEPFSAIWLHKELPYEHSMIFLIAMYMIIQMFANNYSSFLCGVGYIRLSVVIAAVSAVGNIPLSVFFADGCGLKLSGVILGSLCIMAISVVCLPIITHVWLRKHTPAKEKTD